MNVENKELMSVLYLTESQQTALNQGISRYIKNLKTNIHIIFDLETNGLQCNKDSVLSISAQKVLITPDRSTSLIEKYTRYYYPQEEYNPKAIEVNGLDEDTLIKLRCRSDFNGSYPTFFVDDFSSFAKFCSGCSNFIGHNIINFDLEWISDKMIVENVFDTYTANYWVPAKYNISGKGPKLIHAIQFYNIDYNADNLHSSSYDVEMTRAVFESMLQLSTVRMKIL